MTHSWFEPDGFPYAHTEFEIGDDQDSLRSLSTAQVEEVGGQNLSEVSVRFTDRHGPMDEASKALPEASVCIGTDGVSTSMMC